MLRVTVGPCSNGYDRRQHNQGQNPSVNEDTSINNPKVVDVAALAADAAAKVNASKAADALAKAAKAKLSAALSDNGRRALGNKFYGSASFAVEGVGKFKAEITRKVGYDQGRLRSIADELDPAMFPVLFSVELVVNEDAYARLDDGDKVKIALTEARTATYGALKVDLVELALPAEEGPA